MAFCHCLVFQFESLGLVFAVCFLSLPFYCVYMCTLLFSGVYWFASEVIICWDYLLAQGEGTFLQGMLFVLPGSWFFNCGEEELSFNVVFFKCFVSCYAWHSDEHQTKYP